MFKYSFCSTSAFWNHVRSQNNPADCVSRGIPPSELINHPLWWEGNKLILDPKLIMSNKKALQIKGVSTLCSNLNVSFKNKKVKKIKIWDLLEKYSDLSKLLRISAYVIRFIHKIFLKNKKVANRSELFSSKWFNLEYDFLIVHSVSLEEINRSRLTWVYLVQRAYFNPESKYLKNHTEIFKQSSLNSFNPFLQDYLLIVGGRVQNSDLTEEEKHPLILPYGSTFSKLIIEFFHLKSKHGTMKQTLAAVSSTFKIVKAKYLVKACIKKCFSCICYNSSREIQRMGNLPFYRVTKPDKPFRISGVDYAGPFNILTYKGRGAKTYKGYIVVFICMATKAVNLELVSGYDSQNFIAAFRRFTSTRGACTCLVSDRGTTFVGADRILKEMYVEYSSYMQKLVGLLADEGTTWKFNPPGAPHFGGIWEAAVKSVKHHINRVLGSTKYTFEEFYTFLKQV